MTGTSEGWVGAQFHRKEDHRLTTGRGRFFADIVMPGAVHIMFKRSDHAHARIKSIDVSAAKAMPGVIAVVTGDDIKDKILSMPQPVVQPALPATYPKHWPLAVGKVKWHGEPVAAVVARDPYIAEDAAETIEVEYDPLPYVGDPESALAEGATIVHEGWPDNVIFEMDFTGGADEESQRAHEAKVQEVFDSADIVIKQRFTCHRCGVTPMETRGALFDWDESDGMTGWITTQRPHIDRLALSDILEIPAEKMRIIAPRDQGGGFGVKAPFYREPILVAYLAKTLGRPVRWVETRQEHLMAVSQERDQIHDLEVAAARDGKLLAIRNRGLADCGDGCEGVYWGFLMPFLGAIELPNAYDWPIGDVKVKVAITNKSALSPARAFGEFPTRFAMERAIDMVAKKCGMEPADVRRKNLVAELPYTSITNEYFDSGDFIKVWDNLMAEADLPGFRARQAEARAEGRYLGIGFGLGVELSGVASELFVPMENQPGYGAATVRARPTRQGAGVRGRCARRAGARDHRRPGHRPQLRHPPQRRGGNDRGYGHGRPSAPAPSVPAPAPISSAPAVQACDFLKEKIARIMAHDLALADASPADFEFRDGFVTYAKDTNIKKTFREAVERIIMAPINMPKGESGGLEHTAFFEAEKPMIAFNADVCTVEVDIETGQFKILTWTTSEDVGQIINPQIVEGQMQGAIVQGLSNTMFEQFVYDENGQQLTADFENYKLATAADVPDIKVTHAPTPCPYTPLGSRGIGEGRPSDVPGTLCNAICDALSPFDIEITDLPLRPDSLWRKIQAARGAS